MDALTTSDTSESLNDAASLLMQLEAGDLPALVRVRKLLAPHASPDAPAGTAAHAIAQAVERLDAAMMGELPLERAVEEVGQWIEGAMYVLVDGVSAAGSATSPQAEPNAFTPAVPAPDAVPAQPVASVITAGFPADADLELMREFVVESREYQQNAEAALLQLENDPEDAEAINIVFRAFHTVKGTSAFMGLQEIMELAHHAESLFDRFRERELLCVGPAADLSLRAADMMGIMLDAVDVALNGGELRYPESYGELLHILAHVDASGILDERCRPGARPRLGDILVEDGVVERDTVESVAREQGGRPIGQALMESGAVQMKDVHQALQKQQQRASTDGGDASVRVRTDRLDRLIDLVGELVVSQSMVAQDPTVSNPEAYELLRKVRQSGKIIRELQDLSMGLRMVPLKPTFHKLARVVRDVAKKAGKEVELITEGEDTEIDRTMVDAISDPLVHMVRNAVDHGVEPPRNREAAGKPTSGIVRLSAYHAGGNVVVELKDDGRGLNRERIVQKAIDKGLIESDRGMSDREVFNLIFAAGFSTAEQVTDISGRGVGMDVVRQSVEALRGRIDIASEPGKGSTFYVRLPLTLAITDGMLVRAGAERYILPVLNIQTSFRPTPEHISTVAGKGEMVLLHGSVIPLVRLHRLFGVAGAEEDPTRAILIVLGDGERRIALQVDEMLGQQQCVAKPLGEGIGHVPGVAGGAVLGDGQVGLILDIPELITTARQGASSEKAA